MKKILFVYNTKTTFTKQDLDVLRLNYEVEEAFIGSIWDAFKFVVNNSLTQYHFAYFWFSSLNFIPIFFAAKLKSLPMIIVAGGYDVANVPEINYGGGTRGWLQRSIRNYFLGASKYIISVSKSNQNDLLNVLPSSANKNSVIYLGFTDPQKEIISLQNRSNKIITIGAVNSVTFERKGLRFFAELSKQMPEWEFLIVGKYDDETKRKLTEIGGENLRFSGYLSNDAFYQEIAFSKFNLQLSFHEGFGVSVVDAALLGVYPVVFDKYSLPEVVANDGAIIPFGNLELVKNTLLKINASGYDPLSLKAAYLKRFSLEDKKNQLFSVLSTVDKQSL